MRQILFTAVLVLVPQAAFAQIAWHGHSAGRYLLTARHLPFTDCPSPIHYPPQATVDCLRGLVQTTIPHAGMTGVPLGFPA